MPGRYHELCPRVAESTFFDGLFRASARVLGGGSSLSSSPMACPTPRPPAMVRKMGRFRRCKTSDATGNSSHISPSLFGCLRYACPMENARYARFGLHVATRFGCMAPKPPKALGGPVSRVALRGSRASTNFANIMGSKMHAGKTRPET